MLSVYDKLDSWLDHCHSIRQEPKKLLLDEKYKKQLEKSKHPDVKNIKNKIYYRGIIIKFLTPVKEDEDDN